MLDKKRQMLARAEEQRVQEVAQRLVAEEEEKRKKEKKIEMYRKKGLEYTVPVRPSPRVKGRTKVEAEAEHPSRSVNPPRGRHVLLRRDRPLQQQQQQPSAAGRLP